MKLSQKQIDILVVDPHPLFREGLKRILEMDPDLHIVAQGENGDQLAPLYERHRPDIVLLEFNLPDKSGVQALEGLIQQYPSAAVLLFSVVDDSYAVLKAFKAGAVGYLLKKMEADSIAAAIKEVVKGGFYLHPDLLARFLAEYMKLIPRETEDAYIQSLIRRPYHLLTYREAEILQLMSEGHTNKSLSDVLHISEKTVKNHVSTILKKMDLNDRTQAVVHAIKMGWVELV